MLDAIQNLVTGPEMVKVMLLMLGFLSIAFIAALATASTLSEKLETMEDQMEESRKIIEDYVTVPTYKALAKYLPSDNTLHDIIRNSIPEAYKEDGKLINVLLTDSLKDYIVRSVFLHVSKHFDDVRETIYEQEKGYMEAPKEITEPSGYEPDEQHEADTFEKWVSRNWNLELDS